jgi:HEPN domain-containing protein
MINIMEKQDLIKYWIKSSDNDYSTSEHLFLSKDYSWCLFIGHLVIEKLLKACYVKNVGSNNPPFSHDLLRIAEKSGLELNDEIKDLLDIITSFNIMTRYDNYKMEFFERCTSEYASEYFNKIKDLRLWLKKKL